MFRPLRPVFLTVALTLCALVATTLPASAQQTPGLFQSTIERAQDGTITVSPTFLTAGLAAQPQGRRGQNQQGFGFGIKGGFLFTSFSAAEEDFDSNTGTAIGIFFGGNRTGAVGVMGELLYVTKSFGEGNAETDLAYLEIPILARINIGSSSVNGLSFYGIAGPVFDIRLKAKLKVSDIDVKDNYESTDIGVIVGAGVEFLRFIAEARYNWGLRNFRSDLIDTEEIKTRTFMVLFGFRIN